MTWVAPSDAPVTWPAGLTVATPLPAAHETGTFETIAPAAVRTVAVTAPVPPVAGSSAPGATETDAASAPGPAESSSIFGDELGAGFALSGTDCTATGSDWKSTTWPWSAVITTRNCSLGSTAGTGAERS